MYGPGVSLRLGQNFYIEFGASHLWLSPLLDSFFTFPAVMISLTSVLSFLRPERVVPPVKIRYSHMPFHPAKCQLLPRMGRIFFILCHSSMLYLLKKNCLKLWLLSIRIRGYLAIPEVNLKVMKCRHWFILLFLPSFSLSIALVIEISFEEHMCLVFIVILVVFISFLLSG